MSFWTAPAGVILLGALLASCGNAGAPGAQGPESGDAGANTPAGPRADAAQTVLELARTVARADPVFAQRLAPTMTGWSAHPDGIVSPGWEPRLGKKAAELAARAPEWADGKWELSLDRTAHYRLAMRWDDAAAAKAEPVDGALVYRGVHAETDAIVTSTTSYVEVTYVLRDHSAPRRWVWHLDGGPGIKGAKPAPDGGLYLVRDDGEPVWNVPAAYAVDARGTKLSVRSEWVEGALEFEMVGAPAAYPVVVDPIVTALFWSQRNSAIRPPERVDCAMAYDAGRSRTVLFGGWSGAVSLGDTWEWDGSNWIQRSASPAPPPRYASAMAYDSARRRIVLFGVSDSVTGFDDTWEWDGNTWTNRAPASGPFSRNSHAMAFDSGRGRTVLFGGNGAQDTWEWDGTSWLERTPAGSPGGRNRHAMAYDSARRRTVLFAGSGAGSASLGDTWEWDGTNWQAMTPSQSPGARQGHKAVYHSLLGQVLIFGGTPASDLWAWNGTSWTRPSAMGNPDSRVRGMAYDSSRERVVTYAEFTWELGYFRTVGSDCTNDDHCATQHCSDGVCCDAACNGSCDVCKASLGASSDGVCTVVSLGTPGSPPCASSLLCNGSSSACPTSCSMDIECISPTYCQDSSGRCLAKLPLGAPCPNGDHACQSGSCLAGICSACAADAQCSANEYCSAAAHGCAPRLPLGAACPEGAHACETGRCLNICACQSDAHCAAGEYCQIPTGRCLSKLPTGTSCPDGDWSCQTGFCNGGVCGFCLDDSNCSADSFCSASGHCLMKLADGASCPEGAHSCVSTFCADGVCCNEACSGACRACTSSLKGSGIDGACGPILSGTDPEGECPADPDYPASCKTDGMCDGNGACRLYAIAGTPCAPASCSGGELTTASCNGAGNCLSRTNSCPGNRACSSAQECVAVCTTDAECKASFACGPEGQCTPVASGSTCKDDRTVLDALGVPRSCAPYRCSTGACLRECSSVDDCVESAVCDDTRHCVVTSGSGGSEGGCACRVGSTSRNSVPGACALGVVAILLAGRRQPRRRSARGARFR